MPLHLKPIDVSAELANVSSVLIVSCPVCPPVSLAVQKSAPLIELFKRGIKTGAFEDYIKEIRDPLEQRGVRTGVFSAYVPLPTMCLWTEGQRRRLLRRAKDYEAVLVLGCDTARYTVEQVLEGSDCQVIQAMQTTGLTNATVKFQFPMTLTLEHVTRVGEGGDIEKLHSPS
jgi:hypothetical protein